LQNLFPKTRDDYSYGLIYYNLMGYRKEEQGGEILFQTVNFSVFIQ
jgi:hypothetical protein